MARLPGEPQVIPLIGDGVMVEARKTEYFETVAERLAPAGKPLPCCLPLEPAHLPPAPHAGKLGEVSLDGIEVLGAAELVLR